MKDIVIRNSNTNYTIRISKSTEGNLAVPTSNKGDKNSLIKAIINDVYWISSDYHIFKELLKTGKEKQEAFEDTKRIIKLHNSIVKKDDPFLLLGDLTESEYGNEENVEALSLVKNAVNRLNGKKIIICGNNDTMSNYFLKQCGFDLIFRQNIENQDLVLSHYPTNITGKQINIHGHIHGSHKYWGVDPKNHIDSYWKLWNGPVKYSFLLDKLNKNEYKGEFVQTDFNDPENGGDIHL